MPEALLACSTKDEWQQPSFLRSKMSIQNVEDASNSAISILTEHPERRLGINGNTSSMSKVAM